MQKEPALGSRLQGYFFLIAYGRSAAWDGMATVRMSENQGAETYHYHAWRFVQKKKDLCGVPRLYTPHIH